MATRATIAKLDDNGIKAIYLHSDGYLEHAGRILDEHYRDESKIDELLAHGDVSSLNENIGENYLLMTICYFMKRNNVDFIIEIEVKIKKKQQS